MRGYVYQGRLVFTSTFMHSHSYIIPTLSPLTGHNESGKSNYPQLFHLSNFFMIPSLQFLHLCSLYNTHTLSSLTGHTESGKSLITHSSFIFVVSQYAFLLFPSLFLCNTYTLIGPHESEQSLISHSSLIFVVSLSFLPCMLYLHNSFFVVSSSGVICTTHTLRPHAVIQESSLLFLLSSGAGHTTHLLFLTRLYDSENTLIPHTGSLIWGEGPFFVWRKLEWLGEVMEEFLEEELLWFSSGGLRL